MLYSSWAETKRAELASAGDDDDVDDDIALEWARLRQAQDRMRSGAGAATAGAGGSGRSSVSARRQARNFTLDRLVESSADQNSINSYDRQQHTTRRRYSHLICGCRKMVGKKFFPLKMCVEKCKIWSKKPLFLAKIHGQN